jgi:hypothetical protein
MNWYYYDGAKQVGPISEADLLLVRQGGAINDASLVWREGMAGWIPFRDALSPPAAGAPPQFAPASGQAQCCECHGYFSTDEMIRHSDLFICVNCKPIFIQRLREGALPSGMGLASGVPESHVRLRDYHHTIGEYLNQSWELFKKDPGLTLGATALVGLCLAVANLTPYLSTITGLVFTGPLLGGFMLFFLKKVRGQTATLGDAFSGFGPRFGQLLLGHLVPSLLASLAMIPGFIMLFVGLFAAVASGPSRSGPGTVAIVTLATGGLFLFLAICVMLYLTCCWLFTLWLVADKNMTFWPAMSLSRAVVRKHWWSTLFLGFVIGLISMVGALACGVGLLVATPVGVGMMALAYEKLFGDMQPAL